MKSRAIVMHRIGGPEVLALEDVALKPLAAGEVRIRVLAAAINHSDLEIRAGNWNIRRSPPFPYVPGLEAVGDVVEVAADVREVAVGDRAWTMMQGLGGVRAERDGGYAEHVTVPAANVAPLPKDKDPVAFASIGLAGVTAERGLALCGPLAGKTVLVTGPSGGVGSTAMAIARAAGATVIPQGRDTAPPAPDSADVILDVVAGPGFPALVKALRKDGHYCIVGAMAGGDVRFDAWELLAAKTLTGYSTEEIDGEALRASTKALVALAPVEHRVMPLAEAARAHELLESRAAKGRIVLVP